MVHALYMYYIDDGHNIVSRKTQMRMFGVGIPGNTGHGYGVLQAQRTL